MSTHHFDTEIAQHVGVNAAILFQNITFWIEKNQANDKHFIEGRYWTYNSVSAFKELFPYLGEKAIRGALKKLIKNGYLVDGEFNKIAYDRTRWYALGDRMVTEFPKRANGDGERKNGDSSKGEPIPDSKPDNKSFRAEDIQLPDTINAEAWSEWAACRRERRKAITERAAAKQLKLLAQFDFLEQQEMIDNAIGSDWTGLFPPKRSVVKGAISPHLNSSGKRHASGSTRDNSLQDDLTNRSWAA